MKSQVMQLFNKRAMQIMQTIQKNAIHINHANMQKLLEK